MVGVPIPSSTWPPLLVDVERAGAAAEGKGCDLVEPGQPDTFIADRVTALYLPLRGAFIELLLRGPDECVLWCSGHRLVLFAAFFPTLPVHPNIHEYTLERLPSRADRCTHWAQ